MSREPELVEYWGSILVSSGISYHARAGALVAGCSRLESVLKVALARTIGKRVEHITLVELLVRVHELKRASRPDPAATAYKHRNDILHWALVPKLDTVVVDVLSLARVDLEVHLGMPLREPVECLFSGQLGNLDRSAPAVALEPRSFWTDQIREADQSPNDAERLGAHSLACGLLDTILNDVALTTLPRRASTQFARDPLPQRLWSAYQRGWLGPDAPPAQALEAFEARQAWAHEGDLTPIRTATAHVEAILGVVSRLRDRSSRFRPSSPPPPLVVSSDESIGTACPDCGHDCYARCARCRSPVCDRLLAHGCHSCGLCIVAQRRKDGRTRRGSVDPLGQRHVRMIGDILRSRIADTEHIMEHLRACGELRGFDAAVREQEQNWRSLMRLAGLDWESDLTDIELADQEIEQRAADTLSSQEGLREAADALRERQRRADLAELLSAVDEALGTTETQEKEV